MGGGRGVFDFQRVHVCARSLVYQRISPHTPKEYGAKHKKHVSSMDLHGRHIKSIVFDWGLHMVLKLIHTANALKNILLACQNMEKHAYDIDLQSQSIWICLLDKYAILRH